MSNKEAGEYLMHTTATHLVYTEQGAFFGGADKLARREAGCRELLEKLGEELRKQS